MDQRIASLLAKPEIERDIGMTRCAREIVIVGIARRYVAAFRLNRGDGVAAFDRCKVELSVAAGGIVVRRAPGPGEIVLQGLREFCELGAIVIDVPGQLLPQEQVAEILGKSDVEAGLP